MQRIKPSCVSKSVWLSDSCQYPYWENIVLGESNFDETIQALKDSRLVDANSIETSAGTIYPYDVSQHVIEFDLVGGEGVGRIALDNDDNPLAIYLYLAKYADLDRVMMDLGQPEFVHAYNTSGHQDCYGADLYNAKLGVSYAVHDCSTASESIVSVGNNLIVREAAEVHEVVYFKPTETIEQGIVNLHFNKIEIAENVISHLHKWRGYSDYPIDVPHFK